MFDVGFIPADTRNLTQRSLRSERMENGGIFNWGRDCSRPEVLGHAHAWIAHAKAAKDAKGGAGKARFLMLDLSPRLRDTLTRGFWIRDSSHP
jgi:hypothetical protein